MRPNTCLPRNGDRITFLWLMRKTRPNLTLCSASHRTSEYHLRTLRAERRIDAEKQAAYIRSKEHMHLASITAASTSLP